MQDIEANVTLAHEVVRGFDGTPQGTHVDYGVFAMARYTVHWPRRGGDLRRQHVEALGGEAAGLAHAFERLGAVQLDRAGSAGRGRFGGGQVGHARLCVRP